MIAPVFLSKNRSMFQQEEINRGSAYKKHIDAVFFSVGWIVYFWLKAKQASAGCIANLLSDLAS